jgi:hypothetical protein
LSYEFTENNCPTGKQTFSDMSGYCAGLKDDARNNGCAGYTRQKEYEAKCSPAAGAAATNTQSPSPSAGFTNPSVDTSIPSAPELPVMPVAPAMPATPEVPAHEVSAAPPATAAPSAPAAAAAKVITIRAEYADAVNVVPTGSGENMIVKLDGKMLVRSADLEARQSVNLAGASEVNITSPDLGSCKFSVQQFTDVMSDLNRPKQIGFSLVAAEKADVMMTSDGCLGKLTLMSWNGFTAVFHNVRLGGLLSTNFAPAVMVVVTRPTSPKPI